MTDAELIAAYRNVKKECTNIRKQISDHHRGSKHGNEYYEAMGSLKAIDCEIEILQCKKRDTWSRYIADLSRKRAADNAVEDELRKQLESLELELKELYVMIEESANRSNDNHEQ